MKTLSGLSDRLIECVAQPKWSWLTPLFIFFSWILYLAENDRVQTINYDIVITLRYFKVNQNIRKKMKDKD